MESVPPNSGLIVVVQNFHEYSVKIPISLPLFEGRMAAVLQHMAGEIGVTITKWFDHAFHRMGIALAVKDMHRTGQLFLR